MIPHPPNSGMKTRPLTVFEVTTSLERTPLRWAGYPSRVSLTRMPGLLFLKRGLLYICAHSLIQKRFCAPELTVGEWNLERVFRFTLLVNRRQWQDARSAVDEKRKAEVA